jgi:hypothetical protein
LYWAEGNKNRKTLGVSNLDSDLLKKIKNWMINYFDCNENKIKIQINAYLNNNVSVEEIISYWTNELSIPKENVGKIIARENYYNGKNRIKKHLYGICQIRYSDVKITQEVFGAIQEIMKIKKNDWIF